MLNANAVTAITDFVLAGELFLIAGLLFAKTKNMFSAAWYWQWLIALMALAAFFGGVDHGFLQPVGEQSRMPADIIIWLLFGFMSFALLQTCGSEFFSKKIRRIITYIGLAQLLVYSSAMILTFAFVYSALNLLPWHLLLLGICIHKYHKHKKYFPLILGLSITLAASAVQMVGVNLFYPLDRNGLYHLIAMIGAYYLYKGGLILRTN